MMKYGRVIILIISLGIVFTGCGKVVDTTSLIQAPMLSNGKENEINITLKEILPPGSEYVTPKNTQQKQSIFTEDIDKDGKTEAFVLYRDMKENRQVHLLMLQEENGKWNKTLDIDTNFNILDYFRLEDLDGDGKKEVILGTSISDSEPSKQLLIYELDGKELVNKVNRSYEWIDISDYNGDNKPEVLILDGEITKSKTAEMFNYENEQLKSLTFVNLNPDGLIENFVSGKLADGKKALFIDSSLGAHSMLTEIVAYDNGKLIKVGDENDGNLFKAYPLYSRDINNDGIIDAGGMYIPKGFEDAAMAEIPFIYTYSDYREDGTHEIIEERYTDSVQHFYIIIPSKWYGKITIQKLDQGVRIVDNEGQENLFEVKWINKGLYNDSITKLGETKDTVFYTDIKEELPISKDNFHLLKDEF
ncbi:hypothetical protein [Clostridium chromiireducens]|uniref:VCBS repeat-containing protein n=2 Tax=Clostridium chromiireducens TaxID=225345 RepID=A0A399IJJ9_9CLOT|nr:hypothetical protein [Clostridium chromiireducens]RII33208.1 hypothetical protein D2A34_20500 [Clostridium chromiireducens]